jgi:hypothetical protein
MNSKIEELKQIDTRNNLEKHTVEKNQLENTVENTLISSSTKTVTSFQLDKVYKSSSSSKRSKKVLGENLFNGQQTIAENYSIASSINSKDLMEISGSSVFSDSMQKKADLKELEVEFSWTKLKPLPFEFLMAYPMNLRNLPLPGFSPTSKHYWMMSFYLGREIRDFDIVQGPRANLVDPTLVMRHRGVSFDYQYQFSRHVSFLAGVFLHRTRFTSRLFPIRIANENLDDELTFNAPTGELKSQPLNSSDLASTFSDTTVLLARLHNRSSYVSLPLAIRLTSSTIGRLQFYGDIGIQLNYKFHDKNTLIIRKNAFERSFESQRVSIRRWINPSFQTGIGILWGQANRVQFFTELNYNRYLGELYSSPTMSIIGQNFGLNIGMRKNF